MAIPFWTADCETDPFGYRRNENYIPRPFIWGAYNGTTGEYLEFDTADALCDFFERQKCLVYAHNGGRFDWHYIPRDRFNADEPLMIINGRLSKFKIGQAEFRDSLNIFQHTPLSKFGGKLDIDYQLMTPERRAEHMQEIRTYLRADCTVLWNALDVYFSRFGRGLTQAGSSMRVWSKMSGIKPPKQSKEQFLRFKPYYYGGRVECFKTGCAAPKKGFKVYDVNSAYPRAMRETHPFSVHSEISDTLPADEEIGRTLITLKCRSRGALPYRQENGELIFPDDTVSRTYHISGWEFIAGLECNALTHIAIKEVHRFPLSVNFAQYIDEFYDLRKKSKACGDLLMDQFGKFYMNGLYGKFGANPGGVYLDALGQEQSRGGYEEYVIATDESFPRWRAEGYQEYEKWGDRMLLSRPLPEERHHYYNVATAASITGYQRAVMIRAMHQVSGLIYMDTDSVTAEDASRLPQGNELGEWKLELAAKRYAVAGKKLYGFESAEPTMDYYGYDERNPKTGPWKIASKGAKLTPHEIERIANGEEIEYVPDVPTYSLSRKDPRYINRKIKRTGNLIRVH